ncbi:phospholipase D-like domain-containing protein [candidate division WOR-3 bacterium]|nr:phospholipase D-like domain-containing protein [candidate division WOR-3 bacterium]
MVNAYSGLMIKAFSLFLHKSGPGGILAKSLRILLFIALLTVFTGCKENVNEPLSEITPVLNTGYYTMVKSLIDEAESSLELMMFLISDTTYGVGEPGGLLSAISDAYQRGVAVRVLLHSIAATNITNREAIQFFKNREMAIRIAYGYSHTKLLLIDDKVVVLGSHNWTKAAFTRNHEASVIIRDIATATSYRDYFNGHYNLGIEAEGGQGDRGTGRQGDKGTGRQGDRE